MRARPGAALLALALAGAGLACRDPEAERAQRLARASQAEALGDLDAAEHALGDAVERDPSDAGARRALAEYWLRRDNPKAARRVLAEAPSDAPLDEDTARIADRIALLVARFPEARSALLRLDGRAALTARERDAFLHRWIDAKDEPDALEPLPGPLRARAVELLIAERELVRAARAWPVLAEHEPEGPHLLDALLRAALRAEAMDALRELEPALRAQATPRASIALHRVLLERGEWAEAEAIERSFLARHPDHPGRYALVLARARRECRSGAAEEGLRLARDAARLRPDRAEGLVEEAIALHHLGRADEAREVVRSALLLEPDNRLALRLAGELDPAPAPASSHRIEIELREPTAP